MDMQIGTDTTDAGGMKLTITYGPTLVSIIFDPSDEDLVIECLTKGFAQAKADRFERGVREELDRRGNGHVLPG